MSLLKKKLLGEATNNISLDELPDIILSSPTSDVSIIPKPIVSLVPYYEFTPSTTNNLDDSGSPMLRISQTPYSSSTNMEFSSPASPALPLLTSSSPAPPASSFSNASLLGSSGTSSLSGFYGVSPTASSCTPLGGGPVVKFL